MAQYYNPKLRVFVTKADKVDEIPHSEGNMIITNEGGEMYFDTEDTRVPIVPSWKELT